MEAELVPAIAKMKVYPKHKKCLVAHSSGRITRPDPNDIPAAILMFKPTTLVSKQTEITVGMYVCMIVIPCTIEHLSKRLSKEWKIKQPHQKVCITWGNSCKSNFMSWCRPVSICNQIAGFAIGAIWYHIKHPLSILIKLCSSKVFLMRMQSQV